MKKLLATLLVSGCVATSFASPDIFDKIGKALDKVDKALNSVTDNTQQSSSTSKTTTSSASYKQPAPNVRVTLNEAMRYGEGVLIPYTMTNNGEEGYTNFVFNLRELNSNFKGERSSIIFNNGKEAYITEEYNRNDNYSLPGEAKRRAYFYLPKLPKGATSIKQVRLGGRAQGGPKRDMKDNYFGEWLYVFPEMQIRDFQESNREGVVCTHPDIKVKYNGAEYDAAKKILMLDYTLTNTGDEDLSFSLHGNSEAYDEDGNKYRVASGVAGGTNSLKLDSEQTVHVQTAVIDVPSKVKSFSRINAEFSTYGTPVLATRFTNFTID